MADVTVKICDRCRKEIAEKRGIAVFEPIFIRSILSLECLRKAMWGTSRFRSDKYDLCEECSNKLVWFMEGAELVLDEEPDGEGRDA